MRSFLGVQGCHSDMMNLPHYTRETRNRRKRVTAGAIRNEIYPIPAPWSRVRFRASRLGHMAAIDITVAVEGDAGCYLAVMHLSTSIRLLR